MLWQQGGLSFLDTFVGFHVHISMTRISNQWQTNQSIHCKQTWLPQTEHWSIASSGNVDLARGDNTCTHKLVTRAQQRLHSSSRREKLDESIEWSDTQLAGRPLLPFIHQTVSDFSWDHQPCWCFRLFSTGNSAPEMTHEEVKWLSCHDMHDNSSEDIIFLWIQKGMMNDFFWVNWQTAHHLISNAFLQAKTLNPLFNQLVRCSFGAAFGGRSLMKIIFILRFWDLAFAGTNSDDSRHQWLKYSRHHSFSLDPTNDEAASCLYIQTDWQVDMPIVLWSLRQRQVLNWL